MISLEQIAEYLAAKASKEGLEISKPNFAPNQDAAVFVLIRPDRAMAATIQIKISGLEQLQNTELSQMESLLNERFAAAFNALKEAA